MRFTSSLAAVTALLACNVHLAAATVAYVLTFEPETANAKHKIALTSLSPSTARVVIAQRAGIEDFHTSFGLTEEEIDAVNTYGLRTKLFEDSNARRRAFIVAPLHAEAESHPTLRLQSRFMIGNPPTFDDTKLLFQDLYAQAYPQAKEQSLSEDKMTTSPWFHIAADAASLVELAKQLAKEKVTVTALLVPEGQRSSSWGTYVQPGKQSTMQKRAARKTEEEEPMAAGFVDVIPTLPSFHTLANSSNSSSNYTNAPLPGILPACYASKKACVSNTRSCTGHGQCSLKYTNKDAYESMGNGECWGCVCGTTKKDGLTTYWAGPACQKKDISVEFWLIALFTIGLLSLVGFAVGTVWSMGEEELPSVIGAGVSGPTARK